ncbi:hypothetical protein SAMN04487911_10147 [Arenibacter nanhaiticus]|uniref:Uncharacterized protein n=1 Tax=Arenibacter nanhaiticus TaxID=558155 RepID=A0A1M6A3B8_9FLAO|nr:hypothetical protein [Arenibacter nanhaiticus]SHI30633.1 hypothetical protein SAMN04487911_10147 [Arenibacter nanhaiticus]
MKDLIFKYLGFIYSIYLKYKKPAIFKTEKGKEFLQMYAESEVKLLFFRALALLKGFKLIDDYSDKKKKSDTVFIFGSGESINELTEKEWNIIKKHNLIGLNYSFVHPIVPDYFLMEMIPFKEMQDYFCEYTKDKYAKVDMFFQFKHILKSGFDLNKYEFKNKAFVHIPHLLPTIYPEILEYYFNDLIKSKGLSLAHLVHHNSHVGCAVMFAQALGYKRIVLLGIDLNGGDYFTDSEQISESYPPTKDYIKLNKLRNKYNQVKNDFKGNLHPTMNAQLMKERGSVSMDEYFRVYQKNIVNTNNVKLYVNSDKSILSEFIEVFDFKK